MALAKGNDKFPFAKITSYSSDSTILSSRTKTLNFEKFSFFSVDFIDGVEILVLENVFFKKDRQTFVLALIFYTT